MSQPSQEPPERSSAENPAIEQKPDKPGGEAESEADKAIREAREKAEGEKAPSLTTAQIAATVISTGLLPH